MKIGIISKYPPIEGGVSSEIYWLAKYLGEKDVDVVVVTDSWAVEEDFRENIMYDELDKLQPKNVELYQVDPISLKKKKQAGKGGNSETLLFSMGLEVDEKEEPDIWYSHYLFPYGITSYFVSKKTEKPLILRHAGSDKELLGHSEYLPLIKIIKDSKIISASEEMNLLTGKLIDINKNFLCSLPEEFNLKQKTYKEVPTIGLIGKESPTKRWRELMEGLENVDEDFSLQFIMNNEEKIGNCMSRDLKDKTEFISFVPPWKMPKFYENIDILYCGEKGFYIPDHKPMVPLEGMSAGTCVCLSDELYGKYKDIYNLKSGEDVVVLNTLDSKDIGEKISEIIEGRKYEWIGKNGKEKYTVKNEYKDYIRFMKDVFEEQIGYKLS